MYLIYLGVLYITVYLVSFLANNIVIITVQLLQNICTRVTYLAGLSRTVEQETQEAPEGTTGGSPTECCSTWKHGGGRVSEQITDNVTVTNRTRRA